MADAENKPKKDKKKKGKRERGDGKVDERGVKSSKSSNPSKSAAAKKKKKKPPSDAPSSAPPVAAAPVPVGKAARKRHLVRWFRDALADATDDAVRVDFLAARDHASVANVIRSRARALERRDASKSHAEAIRLLDNKGHFLNIVDQCVEKKEEEEASAAAAAVAETNRAHWENVKRRHRAKARPRPGSRRSPYDRVGVVNADP